jgi:branched-chain amino acid transport system permease protein
MVMGTYSAAVAVHYGINIWLAILVVAPVAVGIIGEQAEPPRRQHRFDHAAVEMAEDQAFKNDVVGILTMIFGDITEGVPTPLPGIRIGAYQTSGYSLFVIAQRSRRCSQSM